MEETQSQNGFLDLFKEHDTRGSHFGTIVTLLKPLLLLHRASMAGASVTLMLRQRHR